MTNVIMISVDDLIDVARYRNAFGVALETPAIDALMSRGVTFSDTFTPVPLCTPARAAILTGRSPFATEIHHNADPGLEDTVPVGETLYGVVHDAGFYTAARGKTYHGQPSSEVTRNYLDPVLDEADWSGGYRSSGNDLPGDYGDSPVPEAEMYDTITADWAADFLSDPPTTEPFFLSIGFSKPHLSWDVPKEYYDIYDLDEIDVPDIDGVNFEDLPEFFQNLLSTGDGTHNDVLSADLWTDMVRAYLAAVSYADAQVGKVLDAITEADLWDSSTVVLWSDHGYHLGDRDVWKKFTLWEEAAAVPFIIVDPNVGRAGETIETPVSLLDLWPTLANLAGFPEPVDGDGLDLSPLLLGEASELPREGVITSAYGSLSIRTEDWRYTLYNSGEEELFQVGSDEIHGRDVSGESDFADELDQLRDLLRTEALKLGVKLAEAGVTETGSSQDEVFVVIDGGSAEGMGGDDSYYISVDGDVVEHEDDGHDKVFVSTHSRFDLFDNVEDAKLTTTSEGKLVGNGLDNQLEGNGRDNRIVGKGGADAILGREGSDELKGKRGNDWLHGGSGNDELHGGPNADQLYGSKGSDLLYGNGGKDKLKGGEGDDTLNGGKGVDALKGGEGDDLLNGGKGEDVFIFGEGHGRDTIADFEDNIDTLALEEDHWGGGLNKKQVLKKFGTDTGQDIVLDFGNDKLIIENFANRLDLKNDIDIT